METSEQLCSRGSLCKSGFRFSQEILKQMVSHKSNPSACRQYSRMSLGRCHAQHRYYIFPNFLLLFLLQETVFYNLLESIRKFVFSLWRRMSHLLHKVAFFPPSKWLTAGMTGCAFEKPSRTQVSGTCLPVHSSSLCQHGLPLRAKIIFKNSLFA